MSNPTIDFDKMDGLVPGIVQDAKTGEVLMVGFLNPLSYEKTLESGFVTFWSRTRQKLWMKGETSGNRLRVISAATDCDNDTIVFRGPVNADLSELRTVLPDGCRIDEERPGRYRVATAADHKTCGS